MKKILALVIMTIITFSQLSAFAMVESAECACVINALTGDVVFSKNMNQKHAMASTTKIMTAIVAIERCNMDEIVDVSATAANQEGSAAYISEGNQYYMKDLLYGLMLNSGNDAAVAIAEHVAGSEESFAELMNEHNGLQSCTYCKICNDAAAVSGNSRNADCASTGIKFR